MKELDDWLRALAAEVGIDPDEVDIDGVLDLAGDAAHHVVRPAAPLTTYVAGYVIGLAAARAQAGQTAAGQLTGAPSDPSDPSAPSAPAESNPADDVLDRIGAFARAWQPPGDSPTATPA